MESAEKEVEFDLEKLLAECRQEEERRNQMVEAILEEGPPAGVELRLSSSERYAAILEEPDGTGRGRVLFFDRGGFAGHEVRPSPEEALRSAIKEGYIVRADGALDAFCKTQEWELGTIQTDLIRQVNSGQMTFEVYHARVKELRAKYGLDA